MDLTQLAPATVPGWRRSVLFLVWLKDRKIFGLCFLCLSCDAHKSGGILGSWKRENLESSQDWGACSCKIMVFPRCLIKEAKYGGNLPRIKLEKGIPSEINLTQFPREPSTVESAPLHKGALECAPRIPKRYASSPKSLNDSASYTETPGTCLGQMKRPWRS